MSEESANIDNDVQMINIDPTDKLQSDSVKDLVAALSKAQGTIENAAKDSENPHFKNKYADLASIWNACRKQLTENDLVVTQQPFMHKAKGLIMVTTIYHSSGQWLRSFLPINPIKNDPQGLGSAITYMRRYALASLVGVAPDDDDGNAASGNKVSPEEQAKQIHFAIQKADLIIKSINKDNAHIFREDARSIFKLLPTEKQDELTKAIKKFEEPKDKPPEKNTAEDKQKTSAKEQTSTSLDWIDKTLSELNQAKDMETYNRLSETLKEKREEIPEKRHASIEKVLNENRRRIKALSQHEEAKQTPSMKVPEATSDEEPSINQQAA